MTTLHLTAVEKNLGVSGEINKICVEGLGMRLFFFSSAWLCDTLTMVALNIPFSMQVGYHAAHKNSPQHQDYCLSDHCVGMCR